MAGQAAVGRHEAERSGAELPPGQVVGFLELDAVLRLEVRDEEVFLDEEVFEREARAVAVFGELVPLVDAVSALAASVAGEVVCWLAAAQAASASGWMPDSQMPSAAIMAEA